MRRAVVAGCGAYLPERVVTNDELATRLDTSDEWIAKRTGIRQRHIAADGELTSDLALAASERALASAGMQASDLDGNPVRLGMLWESGPAVLVFLRHFG